MEQADLYGATKEFAFKHMQLEKMRLSFTVGSIALTDMYSNWICIGYFGLGNIPD